MTELTSSRRNIATRTPTVANASCRCGKLGSVYIICCMSGISAEVLAVVVGLVVIGGQVGLTVSLSSFLHLPAKCKQRQKKSLRDV